MQASGVRLSGSPHPRLTLVLILFVAVGAPGCMTQRMRRWDTSSPDEGPADVPSVANLKNFPVATTPDSLIAARAEQKSKAQLVATPRSNSGAAPSDGSTTPASALATHADDPPPPASQDEPKREMALTQPLDENERAALAPTPLAVPPMPSDYPIDLTASLRLAERENPQIAEARARIGEALAVQQQARALLFPTLNAGTNYHGHTGNLQRSSGRIFNLSEQSLYLGGGSRTLAAESVGVPAVRIFSPLTDAIFEPLSARQQVDQSRFNARATANNVLLEVATLFLELEGAEAIREAYQLIVGDAREVARLNLAYAKVGLRAPSDANRSVTELKLFETELQRAQEEVAVASTRLVHRLHLDPTVRVHPIGDLNGPLMLVDPSRELPELIETAWRSRPEMGAASAGVGVARVRLNQELARPLLPTIAVGFSGGAFGGGSNITPPLLGRFGGRTDFDVTAYWTLQNFGIGNRALQRNRRALIGQAEAERSKTINLVRREVAASFARARARYQQIDVARKELESAEAGYREDLIRAQGAVGRPIEVLDSVKLLARARRNLIRAIVEYDQAQVALFVSMGSPPPLDPMSPPPTSPLPVAMPRLESVAHSSERPADAPALPPRAVPVH